MTHRAAREAGVTALALALAAAVSLGMARFSYALLLPPMRSELGWNYATAGAMGTANAAGYLLGALASPHLLARAGARTTCLVGMFVSGIVLVGHGLARHDGALYALRALSGAASATVFVSGGLLAARLGLRSPPGAGITPGLILGLYYGGTGWGIVASTVVVTLPPFTVFSWPGAWIALGVASLMAAEVLRRRLHALEPAVPGPAGHDRFDARPFAAALAAYFMFGLGYIGYMTFVITLLRERALSAHTVTTFYIVLGIGVAVSPFLWAGLLQRHRNGRPLALLSGLLAVATMLPVLWPGALAAWLSGALFGSVFLSVVASTTALVRQNLPPAQWASGVTAFTIVFAIGQIIGPLLVGLLADGTGGLRDGLAVSALVLLIGAGLATRQRAVGTA